MSLVTGNGARAMEAIRWSSVSSVSPASTLRAVSMNRSNCGFSSGGRGLRAGMSDSRLELVDSSLSLTAFLAGPPFLTPLVRRPSQGATFPRHAHSPFPAIRTGVSRLLGKYILKRSYTRFQGRNSACEDSPSPQECPYVCYARPFKECHV
jgi:hypothetical protein